MLVFNKIAKVCVLLTLFVCSISTAQLSGKMICPSGGQLIDTAYGMNKKAHRLFKSNLSSPRNKRFSKSKKIKIIKKAIERYHYRAGGYTSLEIAKAIVWASDCTGNDFQWFAGVLGHESYYCKVRKNILGGGDSGCGQFTGNAISEMKLQLKLPSRRRGRIDTASSRSTAAMKAMIKSCYKKYDGSIDGSAGRGNAKLFYNVMNRSQYGVKAVFRKASAMHVDILASAIYLKFRTSLVGGYQIPGKNPGGIASYNGGGVKDYLRRIKKEKGKIKVNNICMEDEYTPRVAEMACEIDEDPVACMEEFEASHEDNMTIAI